MLVVPAKRFDQVLVYQLLDFLDRKSNGPFQLIEVLREMSSEHNYFYWRNCGHLEQRVLYTESRIGGLHYINQRVCVIL